MPRIVSRHTGAPYKTCSAKMQKSAFRPSDRHLIKVVYGFVILWNAHGSRNGNTTALVIVAVGLDLACLSPARVSTPSFISLS